MVTIHVCIGLHSHCGYHMITSSRYYLHGNSKIDKGIVVMVIISDISNIDINKVNRYSIGLSWTSILWRKYTYYS